MTFPVVIGLLTVALNLALLGVFFYLMYRFGKQAAAAEYRANQELQKQQAILQKMRDEDAERHAVAPAPRPEEDEDPIGSIPTDEDGWSRNNVIPMYYEYEDLHPDIILEGVGELARATAKFDVLTWKTREELLSLTEEDCNSILRSRFGEYGDNRGATIYAAFHMFTKYPEVSPKAFIGVYNKEYEFTFTNTLKALVVRNKAVNAA